MSWSRYLQQLLDKKTELDNLSIAIDNDPAFQIPPIIKSSINLADSLKKVSQNSVLLFPEKQLSPFLYVLFRVLFNIEEERIGQAYDPTVFQKGQLLKFKNHVVRFHCVEYDTSGRPARITVEFADAMTVNMALDSAPPFQLTDTNRSLTKHQTFSPDHERYRESLSGEHGRTFLSRLSDFKTHFTNSTIFIAPIRQGRHLLQNTYLNDRKLGDILLLGQVDRKGNIKSVTAGQATGIPALTIAPDFYAAENMIKTGQPVHSLFALADQTLIDSQLDGIISIIDADVPITMISDVASMQNIKNLVDRGFRFWVWNQHSILPMLTEDVSPIADRVKNATDRTIECLKLGCSLLSRTVQLLIEIQSKVDDTSPNLLPVKIFLYEVAFRNLRSITPITNVSEIQSKLNRAYTKLESEKRYLNPDLYSTLLKIIENLSLINSGQFELPKAVAIRDLLTKREYPSYLIVASGTDKSLVEHALGLQSDNDGEVHILYPEEYISNNSPSNGLTIIGGWYKRDLMYRIFHAHVTSKILIMLYDVEERWHSAFRQWETSRESEYIAHNAAVFRAIGVDHIPLDDRFVQEEDIYAATDELATIELNLARGKYGVYRTAGSKDVLNVVPVDYVGGLRTLFRTGSKAVVVTGMIQGTDEEIMEIAPGDLRPGDFVVERSSSRDIIRDIADRILENNGYGHVRGEAGMWRESLKILDRLSGREVVYQNLKAVGCTRQQATIRTWLEDENMISPQDPRDILHIAQAAGDPVLREKFEQVAKAGRLVKQAHVEAGFYLSKQLKHVLSGKLSSVDFGYAHDIWQPIDLNIEEIGDVIILKVIDVGPVIEVDSGLTNRLLSSDRDDLYGAF